MTVKYKDEGATRTASINDQDLVRPIGKPGALETRTVTFDAAADMPADPTNNANVLADLVTLDSFASGKKRCRVSFHGDIGITTFARGALVTINAGDDVEAANRLTITDVTGAGTGSADTAQRMVSYQQPVIEYNLEGTDATIDNVYLIGLVTGGTGAAGTAYVSVEVW